jgi:hypothetical protein
MSAFALRATARQPSLASRQASSLACRAGAHEASEGWWEADGIEPLAPKGPRLQRGDGASLSLLALPDFEMGLSAQVFACVGGRSTDERYACTVVCRLPSSSVIRHPSSELEER